MYENDARAQKQTSYAAQSQNNQQAAYLGQADCATAPRDLTASELIQNRLRAFQDQIGHNNTRLIEMGGRAFGGSPLGGAIAGNAKTAPQPCGHIAVISVILDEIQQALETQRDAITYVEKLA